MLKINEMRMINDQSYIYDPIKPLPGLVVVTPGLISPIEIKI